MSEHGSEGRHRALAGAVAGASMLAFLAAGARAEMAEYRLDPEHLSVAFLVEHLGYAKTLGRFGRVEGRYRFDEQTGELGGLTVIVETASITTGHEERDEHLRSGDFLDTEEYPRMIYTANRARRIDQRVFEIDGELELLGQTRPLTLTATWNKSADYPIGHSAYVMGVSARGSLMRSDYGMTYGVENGWVGDEVEIIIEFEARRR